MPAARGAAAEAISAGTGLTGLDKGTVADNGGVDKRWVPAGKMADGASACMAEPAASQIGDCELQEAGALVTIGEKRAGTVLKPDVPTTVDARSLARAVEMFGSADTMVLLDTEVEL